MIRKHATGGSSYRSVIFYHDAEQQRIAEQVKAEVDASGKWPRPLVTEIVPAGPWWRAEEEHQDYLVKNPGGVYLSLGAGVGEGFSLRGK